MNLEQLAQIATIIEALAVVVSLLFIGQQIRQSNLLAKAANVQSLAALSSPFNLLLAQNAELANIWHQGALNYSNLSEIDQTRYMFLVFHAMTLQEHIYSQWKSGLIATANYESWRRSFEAFFGEHHLWTHWEAIKGFYEAEFAAYLEGLTPEHPAPERSAS